MSLVGVPRDDRTVQLVAHRAADRRPDRAAGLAAAADVADAVELDVHRFRRRLEIRHAKVVWPTRMLWDKWWLDTSPPAPPQLADVLRELPATATVWLDLKGWSTTLTRDALAAVDASAPGRPVVVSSRSWWILRPARRRGVRVLRSVGSRWQLWAVGAVRRWHANDGVAVADRLLRRGVLQRLRRHTGDIAVWGVHDAGRATELITDGATRLILDDLDLIAELRDRTTPRGGLGVGSDA